ncbi:MAG TPA: hypothetical protein VFP89_05860 [Propionibacteriaceae bacterium]|nr:hypothetical protein [Propionibacteriaceae bacterium]
MASKRRRTPARDVLRRAGLAGLALLTLCLSLLINPTAAYACSCTSKDLRDALNRADVVFLGKVEERESIRRPAPRHTRFTFSVTRVYKGSAYTEQRVVTARSEAECGFTARPGATLVVFATQQAADGSAGIGELSTGVCSGNLATSQPPSLLGRGYPPLTGSSEEVDKAVRLDRSLSRLLALTGITVVGTLGLGAIGLALLWRRASAGSD